MCQPPTSYSRTHPWPSIGRARHWCSSITRVRGKGPARNPLAHFSRGFGLHLVCITEGHHCTFPDKLVTISAGWLDEHKGPAR